MSTTPPPADAAWRLEVGRMRAAHPRRQLPWRVHVGTPAARRVEVDLPPPRSAGLDAGLRFDVVNGLVEAWRQESRDRGDDRGGASCWLSRPGVPDLHDEDQAWFAAASHAFGAHRLELVAFRAVTATGWLDVPSGARRTWRRLRL